jgi:hypothetical protein
MDFYNDQNCSLLYTFCMKKSLLATNPHLKDAATRERSLARNIESSSAVEGIWVKRDSATGRFCDKPTDSSVKAAKKTGQ